MSKRKIPTWVLIWAAALLLALVIFFANKPAVDRLFEVTGIAKLLYPNGTPSTNVVHPTVEPSAAAVVLDGQNVKQSPLPATSVAPIEPTETDLPPKPTPTFESSPDSGKVQGYPLYFLKLTPDGRLEPTIFTRELPVGLTPLTSTIRALLQGPSLQDKSEGAITMIPEGTKLLSIRVKDKVALVSLSEEFQHNTMGSEGLAGQLKQIVWTATQFSSVDSVQFLIEGQYREFLGEEGLSIARPLTRANLR